MKQEIQTPGGLFQITVSDAAGSAQFATEDADGQTFKPFPEQLHVLESFDQLTYDQVWDYLFTDKFFELTPAAVIGVKRRLEACSQRATYVMNEGKIVVAITLPGRLAPNEKLRLYQNATTAGYTIEPIRLHGLGACVFSEIHIYKGVVDGQA